MGEWADPTDLNSVSQYGSVGSSPTEATMPL